MNHADTCSRSIALDMIRQQHHGAPTAISKALSLTAVRLSKLPSEEILIRDGESVLESSISWERGKTINNVEIFFCHPSDSRGTPTPWYCRVSKHRKQDVTFEQLWEKLGKNKVPNEKKFRPEIRKITQIKDISESQSIWSIYYSCRPPLSPRVSTLFQVVRLNDYPPRGRMGIMISIPVDLSSSEDLAELEERGVRGRQVRVEWIKELDDGNMIEWRMASCEDLGGLIPKLCVERSMPGRMALEVFHFMSWLRGQTKRN